MEIELLNGDTLFVTDLSKWYIYKNTSGEWNICSAYNSNMSYKITKETAKEIILQGKMDYRKT